MTSRLPIVGVLTAEGISLIGTRVSMIAIPWFVLTTTGSATKTGIVAAAEMAPMVITKVLGGPWLDRLGPRRVVLACNLLSALVVATIPLLHDLDLLSFPVLLGLVALAGALRGPADAGLSAMGPDLAETAGWSLERVSGLGSVVERTATMGGAALAGVLVSLVGAAHVLYLDALTFALAFAVLAATTRGVGLPVPREDTSPTSYVAELGEGWRFLRHEPVLLALCLMVAATNLVDQAYFAVLAPVWAKSSGAGVGALATIFAVFAAASAVGALCAAAWGETMPRLRVYVIAFLICGAPRFIVFGLDSALWALIVVTIAAGFASGFLNPIIGAVMFERIPPALRGRVSSLFTSVAFAFIPLGSVLGGFGVSHLGLATTFFIAGALYFATTMAPVCLASFRGMERPEAATREPEGTPAPTR